MRNALLLCTLLGLGGCSFSSHIVTGTIRDPVTINQVKIYFKPPAQYEEIAVLDANSWGGAGSQGKTDMLIRRLKQEAAQLGANGVLMQDMGSEVTGVAAAATPIGNGAYVAGGGVNREKTARALAIYVPISVP